MSAPRYTVGSNQYVQHLQPSNESSVELGLGETANTAPSPTMRQAEMLADPNVSPQVSRLRVATGGSPGFARLVRHDPSPTVRAVASRALGEQPNTLDKDARFIAHILSA